MPVVTGPVARRVVVVSRFLPDPAGPASARLLHGFATGARELGHDVEIWSWWPGPSRAPVPPWVTWRPLPREPAWRVRGRALLRPRSDAVATGWRVQPDALAVAEEPLSFPVVRRHPHAVATTHYSTVLDRRAVGGWAARDVQDLRFEPGVARSAAVSTAYSHRVARHLGRRTRAVPAAIAVPDRPASPVERPVAACIADWSWPPNRRALGWLLAAWPLVRDRVPGAELVLAGFGDPGVGTLAGVRWLGPLRDTSEVLAGAAVLAFPCPPTSGPKVKVLEAMALGLPVLTTAAGVEGLEVGADAYLPVDHPDDREALAAVLAAGLVDAARRAQVAVAARHAVLAAHAPRPAAARRLAVIAGALSGGR